MCPFVCGRGSRLRSATLTVVVVIAFALLNQTAALLRADTETVLSDSGDAISRLLLHYDPEMHRELFLVYRDLFRELPTDVAITVICPSGPAAERFLASWEHRVAHGGRDVEVINAGLPLTIWARDRYVARQTGAPGGRSTGWVPAADPNYEVDRLNELQLPHLLFDACLGPPVLYGQLFIEGGNIVSNDRHVFVGANSRFENLNRLEEGQTFDVEVRRIFGRPIVFVGDSDSQVPWCHVDMYLTPIDNRTILVGDPGLTLDSNPLRRSASNCPGDALDDDEPTLQARFDAVAQQVERLGYRVFRLPVIVDPDEEWMITYNNALMERRNGRRHVYLPAYGKPALDGLAASIYRGLGFVVHKIDVSAVYLQGGAVRCIANVVERSSRTAGQSGTGRARNGRLHVVDLNQSLEWMVEEGTAEWANRRAHRTAPLGYWRN